MKTLMETSFDKRLMKYHGRINRTKPNQGTDKRITKQA